MKFPQKCFTVFHSSHSNFPPTFPLSYIIDGKLTKKFHDFARIFEKNLEELRKRATSTG